jgi:hypothetical protein
LPALSRKAKILSLIFLASSVSLFIIGVVVYNQQYKPAGMIYFGIGCIFLGVAVYKPLSVFHTLIIFFFAFLFIWEGVEWLFTFT